MAVTSFACSCGAVIRVTPATAGKTGPCPRCKAPVRAPALDDGGLSNTLANTRGAPAADDDPLARERIALELERAKLEMERAEFARMRADPENLRPTPARGTPAVGEFEIVEELVAIESLPVDPHEGEKPCPDCREWIKRQALVCRHCGWGRRQPEPQVIVQGASESFVMRQILGLIFLALVVFFCLLGGGR